MSIYIIVIYHVQTLRVLCVWIQRVSSDVGACTPDHTASLSNAWKVSIFIEWEPETSQHAWYFDTAAVLFPVLQNFRFSTKRGRTVAYIHHVLPHQSVLFTINRELEGC